MNILLLDYEAKRRGYTRETLAKAIGVSRSAFYRKCAGKTEFTLAEIKAIASVLELENIGAIFFTEKVS